MKILQINAVNKISSTGRNVYELGEYLEAHGNLCAVAFSDSELTDPVREYLIGSFIDRKLHALLSRITGKQAYFSKGATKKLLCYIDNLAPDVIVLNNLHGNFMSLPLLLNYIAKKDIPTVAVLHDCWFYTGKCCHYTVEGCYKWQDRCGNCPTLKTYNKSWFFDKTEKMLADKKRLFGAIPHLAVVGVSDWITEQAKNAPVFQNAKIFQRIYNWIDTEKFSPKDTVALRRKLNLENKKIILCVASNWSREKGLDTVTALSHKLNDNEVMIVVGDLPDNTVFDEKVITVAATDSLEELAVYYSLADVFVQTSLQETFGKVTAEALSCGTPAVCFDSTANPELIGENCGAVVPTGDTDKMLEQIRNVLTDGKQHYSQYCREFARSNFSKDINLQQYLELFNKL